LTAIHLHASVSILAGDTTHIVGNQRMASKKYENFKQYSMLFPEYSFVFIGDSGQGDIYLATLALNDPEIDVLAVFIHDIISTPIIRRKEYQSQGIFLCDNYISAGIMAWQLELISSAGLLRIIEASINDFYGIQWRKTKNHLHLQQQRLWELYSAIFFISTHLSLFQGQFTGPIHQSEFQSHLENFLKDLSTRSPFLLEIQKDQLRQKEQEEKEEKKREEEEEEDEDREERKAREEMEREIRMEEAEEVEFMKKELEKQEKQRKERQEKQEKKEKEKRKEEEKEIEKQKHPSDHDKLSNEFIHKLIVVEKIKKSLTRGTNLNT